MIVEMGASEVGAWGGVEEWEVGCWMKSAGDFFFFSKERSGECPGEGMCKIRIRIMIRDRKREEGGRENWGW